MESVKTILMGLTSVITALLAWFIQKVRQETSRADQAEEDAKELTQTIADNSGRERNHEKRLEAIDDSNLDPGRITGMLSSYPPENKKTNGARAGRRGSPGVPKN